MYFQLLLQLQQLLYFLPLKVPLEIIVEYKLSIHSAAFSVLPLVNFVTLVRLCRASPGLILSGLYPTTKSLFSINPDNDSRIFTQYSSVAPGYTVLSYIMTGIISFTRFFINEATVSEAFLVAKD